MGMSESDRLRLVRYTNRLEYERLKLSDEKIKELEQLFEENEAKHRKEMHMLRFEDKLKEQRNKNNEYRREKRKRTKELIQKHLEKERIAREKKEAALKRISESKKKYKSEKCESLQVFLDKALVKAFKAKVKDKGLSQAEVIRDFIADFVSE